MEKIRNSRLLKQMLVLVLCLAMGFDCLPVGDYSVKVEAADVSVPNYSMYITTSDQGQVKLTTNVTYSYTGLNETTTLNIESDLDGKIPTVSVVPDADSVDIVWSVDSENKVIAIASGGNTTTASIKRVGPGAARVTCNITWRKNGVALVSKNVTSTIKIPADINKTTDSVERDRIPFTKLTDGDDKDNTVLMFNTNKDDIFPAIQNPLSLLGKKVILSYGTKSTLNSVNWTSANTSIATISRTPAGDDEIVNVIPQKAGTTLITASSAISANISDSFYAVIMPTLTYKDKNVDVANVKTVPNQTATAPVISNLNTVEIMGGETIYTNALKTNDLKWKVALFSDKDVETNLLRIKTTDGAETYIESGPKAGVYRITAQAIVPGKVIKPELGVAQMYAKVPLKFPNGYNVVLGLYDTYNIMDNSNIQAKEDITFQTFDKTPDTLGDSAKHLNITEGKATGKSTGLAYAKFKITPGAAAKYGLVDTVATDDDYDKYVTNGIDFTFSVVESFGINNSDITLALKGTADLSVATQSFNGITWTSSNDNIVEITNDQGKTCTISAKNVGTAIVTVTQIVDGVTKTAQCKVTVVKSADTIAIDPATIDMNVDDTKMITAKLTPDNMLIGNLKWSSSDEKVVKIDSQSGKNATIKGIGDGTALITVINTENAIIATSKVTVHGKATGISITPSDSTVNLSNSTLQMTAVVQPSTFVQPELTWLSSDNEVATVDTKGLVSLKKSGNVTITAFVKNSPSVSGSAKIKVVKNVEGLKLEANTKVIYTGEKYKLGYTLTPADAVNQKIKWISTKPSVATVDQLGNVIGVSVGDTIILAQSEDGRYTDYCSVSVKQIAKNIKITTKDVTLSKGQVYDIVYTVDPTTSTDISVKWESMNTAIATVTQTGKVTAASIGSTTILAKTTGGEIAYCNITVVEKANGIKLNYEEKIIYRGNSFTLKSSILPEGATNRKVTYVSSKPSVATISTKGIVKGIATGTTLVTVTSEDGGFKATCVVTVKEMVTKIKLNYTFYAVGVNSSFKLIPTVTTTNTSNKRVNFTSSNTSVAYVSSTGQVTGRKLGYAKITVRALDGSGTKAICTVRVVRPTTNLKLDRVIMTMIVGRSTRLKATVTPKNATYKTVKWTSSDPQIARVLSDGTITALQPGLVTITASSKDNGGKKKAVCYVTIKEAVTANGVMITSKNPVMVVGEKSTMSSALTPYNSTDYVRWESDNKAVASINSSTGTISARSSGTATIIAVSASGKTDSTTVTVVGLDIKNMTLQQYTTNTISVIGAPSGVSWYSENPSIATVLNGKVITRRVGRTRIVAVVKGRRLYCNLNVTSIN